MMIWSFFPIQTNIFCKW